MLDADSFRDGDVSIPLRKVSRGMGLSRGLLGGLVSIPLRKVSRQSTSQGLGMYGEFPFH